MYLHAVTVDWWCYFLLYHVFVCKSVSYYFCWQTTSGCTVAIRSGCVLVCQVPTSPLSPELSEIDARKSRWQGCCDQETVVLGCQWTLGYVFGLWFCSILSAPDFDGKQFTSKTKTISVFEIYLNCSTVVAKQIRQAKLKSTTLIQYNANLI